ncbi:MAG: ubiquinone biosynthesis protein UbiH [Gallionellaceae bacterium]|nr:MAG: ubiquinone biosynthesis protein UbiH [Gallionellaceae bacterium]
MNTDFSSCDIAIIGGGPVGTALALALRESGLNIVVLEARKAEEQNADPRALALSYGSRLLLDKLGVWKQIPQVSGIKTIHVSQKDSSGTTLLHAAEMKVPELGYVLPYPALQRALHQALLQTDVTYLECATVRRLENAADGAALTYQYEGSEHRLDARLAVVADGGKLLEASHPPKVSEYGQSAVIAHITCTAPKIDTAFERFTAQGPVALLPYRGGYEIVWTGSHEQAQAMLQWDDATFLAGLHRHFGDAVGEFLSVGKRSRFPLRLKRAPDTTLPHTVLIGNAAQTLHPVAGQGFNMGVRDAWELARIILRAQPAALGTAAMLEEYRKSRRLDRNAGIVFTDGLVRIFSNDLPLLSSGRGWALSVLDHLPLAKKFVAKRMMFGANG